MDYHDLLPDSEEDNVAMVKAAQFCRVPIESP